MCSTLVPLLSPDFPFFEAVNGSLHFLFCELRYAFNFLFLVSSSFLSASLFGLFVLILHLFWESFFFLWRKFKVRHDTSVVTLHVCILSFASASLLYLIFFLLISPNCLLAPCGVRYVACLPGILLYIVLSATNLCITGHFFIQSPRFIRLFACAMVQH